jgi:hypothetical protein
LWLYLIVYDPAGGWTTTSPRYIFAVQIETSHPLEDEPMTMLLNRRILLAAWYWQRGPQAFLGTLRQWTPPDPFHAHYAATSKSKDSLLEAVLDAQHTMAFAAFQTFGRKLSGGPEQVVPRGIRRVGSQARS